MHLVVIFFVEKLRPQILCDVWEIANFKDLIESYYILKFYIMEWLPSILERGSNVASN